MACGDSLGVLERAAELGRAGRAFALLTVVRTEGLSSGKIGDKGLLSDDGQWWGWVGGSCAGPVARRHARASLETGECRLLCISRDSETPDRPGVVLEPMTCFSGGTVEILIEPCVPAPELVVFGDSPVAAALRLLGEAMGYRLRSVDPNDAESPSTSESSGALGERAASAQQLWVVVASHGDGDAMALRWALAARAQYVGLIASRRRHAALQKQLIDAGLDDASVAQVRGPAGLDIGAKRASEVAVSVLAECVAVMRSGGSTGKAEDTASTGAVSPPGAPEAAASAEAKAGCGCGGANPKAGRAPE